MGKTHRSHKEEDLLAKLKRENKNLKAQVSKLRAVISNIDTNHYRFVQDMFATEIFNQEGKEAELSRKKKAEAMWGCHTCGKGILRLIILGRAGQDYYFRKCDSCDHKTKMQPYTEDVKGV